MFGKRVLMSLVGLGAGGLLLASAGVAQATVFFDPAGTATFPVDSLTSFDWAPGNSIAVHGVTAINNFVLNAGDGGNRPVTFDYFYQARLATYNLSDFSTNLMPSGKELTIVAGITEKVVAVSGPFGAAGAQANFEFVPGLKFLEIYYDGAAATQTGGSATGHANNLAGTGFNDGQLILKAVITAVNPTTFSISGSSPTGGVALDQTADGNEYPTINTVVGNGSTTAFAEVSLFDPNFFSFDPSGPGIIQLSLLQNVGLDLPFATVDPSSGFVTAENVGGIGTVGPAPDLLIGPDNTLANNSVGLLNGVSGPDIVFQTDTNQTFSSRAVPEPVTASLSLLGLAGVGLMALRRRA